jgi:uncharacterized protein YcfJ
MKNTLLALSLLAVASASAQPIVQTQADTAEVLDVQLYQQPGRESCQQVQVQGPPVYHQDRSNTGAVLGGIAGALLGNSVGGGDGRALATALGAGTGAIVGDRLGNRANVPQVYERRCTVQPGPTTYIYKALIRRTGLIISGATSRPLQVGQLMRASTTITTMLEE